MAALKRIIGVVLIVIAAIVAIQTVFEPIYHTSTDDSPYSSAWDYINPLSAISIILGVIFGYIRMSPCRRGFERSRIHSSEHDVLWVHVRSYNLLLELVRHQRYWIGLYRRRSQHPVIDMDYL